MTAAIPEQRPRAILSMAHPMHLQGMFVELENGQTTRMPRKHVTIVRPGREATGLLARVRAVLRRAAEALESIKGSGRARSAFEGWVLDTGRRELMATDGAIIDLAAAEYDLLLAFIEHPQRVMTRDQLLGLARGRVGDVFDRSVDVLVGRLRLKIGRDADGRPLIKAMCGAGYLFTGSPRRL